MSLKKPEKPAPPEQNSEPTANCELPAKPQAAQQTMTIDDADVIACYSNFCRVQSTPEELVLDLGLNPQPLNPAVTNIKVSQRIILNHFTAKRMLAALSAALQRHERAFGVLETDVRKRIQQA